MVKNRDAKQFKRSERQTQIAGKLPFHRVNKLKKKLGKMIFGFKNKKH